MFKYYLLEKTNPIIACHEVINQGLEWYEDVWLSDRRFNQPFQREYVINGLSRIIDADIVEGCYFEEFHKEQAEIAASKLVLEEDDNEDTLEEKQTNYLNQDHHFDTTREHLRTIYYFIEMMKTLMFNCFEITDKMEQHERLKQCYYYIQLMLSYQFVDKNYRESTLFILDDIVTILWNNKSN